METIDYVAQPAIILFLVLEAFSTLLFCCWQVTACAKCNSKKGQKTLEEANMKLIKVPKVTLSLLCFHFHGYRCSDELQLVELCCHIPPLMVFNYYVFFLWKWLPRHKWTWGFLTFCLIRIHYETYVTTIQRLEHNKGKWICSRLILKKSWWSCRPQKTTTYLPYP